MRSRICTLLVADATAEEFSPFGSLIDPQEDQRSATEVLSKDGVFAYYPQDESKMLNPGGEQLVCSPLEMCSRPRTVRGQMEYHHCHETLLFLDNVILVVGPQVPESGSMDGITPQDFAAFAVEKNCAVVLKPRTLHALAFPRSNRTARGLVFLPYQAHQTDCHFVDIPEGAILKPQL
ncbi:MAG: hypothetical protein HUU49_03600 [Candidatus Buchananbacteria bacterium]|nr:hypothetical protein [Candidatus Buchananbacteria bacterium]